MDEELKALRESYHQLNTQLSADKAAYNTNIRWIFGLIATFGITGAGFWHWLSNEIPERVDQKIQRHFDEREQEIDMQLASLEQETSDAMSKIKLSVLLAKKLSVADDDPSQSEALPAVVLFNSLYVKKDYYLALGDSLKIWPENVGNQQATLRISSPQGRNYCGSASKLTQSGLGSGQAFLVVNYRNSNDEQTYYRYEVELLKVDSAGYNPLTQAAYLKASAKIMYGEMDFPCAVSASSML